MKKANKDFAKIASKIKGELLGSVNTLDEWANSPEEQAELEKELLKMNIERCCRCGGWVSNEMMNEDGLCEPCWEGDDDEL